MTKNQQTVDDSGKRNVKRGVIIKALIYLIVILCQGTIKGEQCGAGVKLGNQSIKKHLNIQKLILLRLTLNRTEKGWTPLGKTDQTLGKN